MLLRLAFAIAASTPLTVTLGLSTASPQNFERFNGNALPMIDAQCGECRLWRELASATIEHIRLDNQLRIAKLQGNHLEKLREQTEFAAAGRARSREAITQHQRIVHSAGGATANA